ncbi:MAG: aminotransferase class IV family protein [Bacteroidota bacterium]
MFPFIETIKLLDGELKNLSWHQERLERTRFEVLGLDEHPELLLEIPVPDGLDRGLFKCRVLYGEVIERIEYEPYYHPDIHSLKLVRSDSISYGYKSADRSDLDALYAQKGDCDDILIVKNGCITDSYFANVALFDGTHWHTPDTPLLKGTMRAFLLEEGVLTEARIKENELGDFQKIRLINAMNSLDEGPEIVRVETGK